jgi:hypothetical protein
LAGDLVGHAAIPVISNDFVAELEMQLPLLLTEFAAG